MVDKYLRGDRTLQPRAPLLRLLYVGDLAPGTTSRMRCESLRQLGFQVVVCATDAGRPGLLRKYAGKVAFRLRYPFDHVQANQTILKYARDVDVLWLDKANSVWPDTLIRARRMNTALIVIGYSPDDMIQPHCSSHYFVAGLKHYDAFITTKSFGVPELAALGCRQSIFSPNAYDPATHVPPADHGARKPIQVGFIGHYEDARCNSIRMLCQSGVPVTVTGPGWLRNRRRLPANATCMPSAMGPDYTRRIHETVINLGFLRKMNRDVQTQRSVEVPACAGFLLAERTAEHQSLFEEGVEADYFSGDEELLRKVSHYLARPAECSAIGIRALERCRHGRYSYAERLRDAIADVPSLARRFSS